MNGVAAFSDLSINNTGSGYTLTTSAANLTGATSGGFSVRNPPTFTTASAGSFHSCGVAAGGAAYCLGTEAAAVLGGPTFANGTAGRDHTCGVTSSGGAYCWGDNSSGHLGDGTDNSRSAPVAVSGGLTFGNVSAGRFHSCGVTTGNAAYFWCQCVSANSRRRAGGEFKDADVCLHRSTTVRSDLPSC